MTRSSFPNKYESPVVNSAGLLTGIECDLRTSPCGVIRNLANMIMASGIWSLSLLDPIKIMISLTTLRKLSLISTIASLIIHHIILQHNSTTSSLSTPNMVRLLTIVTVLFASASSVAASYCQCLYPDASHCCVIVSCRVSLRTQVSLAHNFGVSRTT